MLLGVQNADGEWVAIAAGTPVSPPRYLAKSTRMDSEFLAVSGPRKRENGRLIFRRTPSDHDGAAF